MIRLLVALALMVGASPVSANEETESPRTVARRGPVEATLSIVPASPRLGDPITLELDVRSEPDVEVLLPEFFESLGRFEVREYRADDDVDESGRNVAVRRCEIVPPRSGDHSIPPLLIEFLDRRPGRELKPEGEPAYELLTDRLAFEVAPVSESDVTADFEPPYGELAPLPVSKQQNFVRLLVVIYLATAATALGVTIFWVLVRETSRRARRRTAYQIALARLQRLDDEGIPRTDAEIDQYYVELTSILRRYLESRFSLRASDRTTEEFVEHAASQSTLDTEKQDQLRELLASADLVKFAHRLPSSKEMTSSLDRVRTFLDETQENSPLVDLPDEGTTR